jgi:hypothetical protein
MTAPDGPDRRHADGLVRWYPPAWRARYGDELAALVEDELAGKRPTLRVHASLARAGLSERIRASGLVGVSRPPTERVRAGGLLVLVAWATAAVAGSAFAKSSEHFAAADPGRLTVAQAAYAAVVVCAVVGAVVVAAAVGLALPALPAFGRDGGWAAVRAPLVRASVLTSLAAVAVVPLSVWAHHLNGAQRNGADLPYTCAFLAWGALVAATVMLWTAAGIAVARRLDLRARNLRVEASLALALAAVVVVLAASIAVWWAAMAESAPWFLGRDPLGTHPTPVSGPLLSVGALLAVAVLAAGWGAVRVVRSWHSLPVD